MKNCFRIAIFHVARRITEIIIVPMALLSVADAQATGPNVKSKSDPKPISICDLFKDIRPYEGKVIAVRGIYYHGLREGNCPHAFEGGDRVWPTVLDLATSNTYEEGEPAVSFDTDDESWDKLNEVAIREGKKGLLGEIWVTMVGQLRGPQRHLRNGHPGGVGCYGHLGAFPAQLVVERVFDIAVKTNGTHDYRKILPPHLRRSK
jgi:hypothetical protein